MGHCCTKSYSERPVPKRDASMLSRGCAIYSSTPFHEPEVWPCQSVAAQINSSLVGTRFIPAPAFMD